MTAKVVAGSVIGFAAAVGAEFLAESGMSLIDWEASWAESSTAFIVGIIVAALLVILVCSRILKNSRRTEAVQGEM